jgi:hypothetical protein
VVPGTRGLASEGFTGAVVAAVRWEEGWGVEGSVAWVGGMQVVLDQMAACLPDRTILSVLGLVTGGGGSVEGGEAGEGIGLMVDGVRRRVALPGFVSWASLGAPASGCALMRVAAIDASPLVLLPTLLVCAVRPSIWYASGALLVSVCVGCSSSRPDHTGHARCRGKKEGREELGGSMRSHLGAVEPGGWACLRRIQHLMLPKAVLKRPGYRQRGDDT